MGTFLCSGLLLLAVLQEPPAAPAPAPAAEDSVTALWAQVASDSTNARAWFDLGREYVRRSTTYHRHTTPPDTAWARATLDTASRAFGNTATLLAGTATGDSAQTFRVFVWAERAFLAWEGGGLEAAAEVWRESPADLRLPPVLQELGENLLRTCPNEGVLVTTGDAGTYAAWYMRFARGMRTDLLILPYNVWLTDSVFRGRLRAELRLPRAARAGPEAGPSLKVFARQRPVCASMGFERPPEPRAGFRWTVRSLVWVTGPVRRDDRVPPQDFVFAALRLALDTREPWAVPVRDIYRRAAGETPALCAPMAVFGVREEVGCRK